MYIEFGLPKVLPDLANHLIDRALHSWSMHYQIPYNTKTIKYTKRVTFDHDENYSLFALTWNIAQEHYTLGNWRIITDPNNKI
jgi:hypothetical protein